MADTFSGVSGTAADAFPTQTVEVTGKRLPKEAINQQERLFINRPRYAKESLLTGEDGDLGGNRGQWGYIKLLTSQTQYSQYLSGSGPRVLTYSDLVGSDSIVANMADPSGTKSVGYDKFLITSVSAAMSEKMQITEVFGDSEVVYYFGHQPVIFNISGILIDSPDNDWFTQWLKMYSEFLRGSQLAKNYELLKLVLPNMALTGSISNFSFGQDSNRDVDIPFSFQFVAKLIEPVPVSNNGMITSNKLKYIDFSQVAGFSGQASINAYKEQMANLSNVIQNPTSSLFDRANALNAIGTGTGGAFGEFLQGAKGTLTGYQSTIDGWTRASNDAFRSIQNSAIFQTVSSSLAGIRTNLFSPVYGILSSLTKLVSNTANSAVSLVSSLITPVRNILRDITNISNQAVALVNLVNTSIRGVGRYTSNQISGLSTDFTNAIHSLGKAAGAIATAPITVAESVGAVLGRGSSGIPPSPAFLRSTPNLTFSRPTLVLSDSTPLPTKSTLLFSIPRYSTLSTAIFQ